VQKRTLIGLSLCYLVVYTIGNGLLPLMPIYAQSVGATREAAGYYVAFVFLCISAGALTGGRLSDTTRHHRILLVGAGTLSIPATWLIGRVGDVWQLALATGASWLLSGVILGIVGSIAGRQARDEERGRVFGILGVMISLSALIGGLTFGRMVDAWGYAKTTLVVSFFFALVPLAAFLEVGGGELSPARRATKVTIGAGWVSPAFLLVLVSEILGMTVAGTGNMARSLLMNEKAFPGSAITATMAVAGLVSLPLPFVLGWVSDALGRKSVIVASFVAGIASLLLFTVSQSLWQFSVATALLSIHAISVTLGPALIADIVRSDRVGTGLSVFQSAAWAGTISGYVYSGISFTRLGMTAAVMMGGVFPLVAIPFLLLARTANRKAPVDRGEGVNA
jgi:MFS family permease